jgi:hypothetical protein
MSQDGLLLVNVLDLVTSASFAHRNHRLARWPLPLDRVPMASDLPPAIPRARGLPPGRKAPGEGASLRRACSFLLCFVGTTRFRLYGFLTPCGLPGPPAPPLAAAGNPPRTPLDSPCAVGYNTGLNHKAETKEPFYENSI